MMEVEVCEVWGVAKDAIWVGVRSEGRLRRRTRFSCWRFISSCSSLHIVVVVVVSFAFVLLLVRLGCCPMSMLHNIV